MQIYIILLKKLNILSNKENYKILFECDYFVGSRSEWYKVLVLYRRLRIGGGYVYDRDCGSQGQ